MAPTEGIAGRVGAALSWNLATTVVRFATQAAAVVILSRLTTAGAFGLFCQGMAVAGLANIVAHAGLASLVVQRPRLSRALVETVGAAARLSGAAATVVVWLGSPALSAIFKSGDEGTAVLRAMALLPLFNGFSVIALSLDQRRLSYCRLFWIESVSYAVGYGGVGIICAAAGCETWAFVAAAIAHEGIRAFGAHTLAGFRSATLPNLRRLTRTLRFASATSLTGAALFSGRNLDVLLIGRVLGADALGLYGRALQLVRLPATQVTRLISSVLLSAYSRLYAGHGDLARAYMATIGLLTVMGLPAGATLAMAAEPLVTLALGEAWIDAVGPFRVLCLLGYFVVACDVSDRLILACGAATARLRLHVAMIGVTAVCIALGTSFGLDGAAAGVLVAGVVQYAATALVSLRLLGTPILAFLRVQAPGAGLAAMSAVGCWLGASLGASTSSPLAALVVTTAIGASAPTAVVFLAPERVFPREVYEVLGRGRLRRLVPSRVHDAVANLPVADTPSRRAA